MEEPHTHPIPKTIHYNEASELARALWLEIRDVCQNGQAYEVIERYLDLARLEGQNRE